MEVGFLNGQPVERLLIIFFVYFSYSDGTLLERTGLDINYIRADRTLLQFSSPACTETHSLSCIFFSQISDDKTQSKNIETACCIEGGNQGDIEGAEGETEAACSHPHQHRMNINIPGESTNQQKDFGGNQMIEQPQTTNLTESTTLTHEELESENSVLNPETENMHIEVEMPQEQSHVCPFCMTMVEKKDEVVSLTEKGVCSILQVAKKREDKIVCKVGQLVHTECRKKYTNKISVDIAMRKKSERDRSESPQLRSKKATFNFQTDCFYCGVTVDPNDPNIFRSRSLGVKETLLEKCDERKDSWSSQVRARLSVINDLHAADATYHRQCANNFRTKTGIPTALQSEEQIAKRPKVGRPQDNDANEAFSKVADYLRENDDEQITVNQLIDLMQSLLKDSSAEAYSYKWMKKKLQDEFKDEIVFTEINGKANVVTFRARAKNILHNFYEESKQDQDADKNKDLLLKAAAELLKEDIKLVATNPEQYPDLTTNKLSDCLEGVPESLRKFLQLLFSGKEESIKHAFIGQAVMQAVRPKVLMVPLQMQLGVQLHHVFRSRFLIDQLHKLGVSCPYHEVLKFEKNAAVSQGTIVEGYSSEFVQYAGDNVDHNVHTLDGLGTFHGMGIIATITPAIDGNFCIPRAKVTKEQIRNAGKVQIISCREESKGLSRIKYKKLPKITYTDPTRCLDLIWKCSITFGKERPSWAGTMQFVHQGNHPGKASIMILPMIDMNPSDPTCISSTLHYVANHAKKYKFTPIITFDQPLYWKALSIVLSEDEGSILKKVVLKMGGLHTIMSFLGSIGYLMANTGLEEVLETIYAKNSIDHMMSGKIIYRALRGHFIVDAALNGLLISEIKVSELPDTVNLERQDGQESSNMQGDDLEQVHDHGREHGDGHEQQHDQEQGHEHEHGHEQDQEHGHEHQHGDEQPQGHGHEQEQEQGHQHNSDNDALGTLTTHLEQLYIDMMNGKEMESHTQIDAVKQMENILLDRKESLSSSRLAKTWLQYMEMVDILKKYLKAERLGDWQLHLQATAEMLPYFAATGHNHYLKSSYIYLQQMVELEEKHPDVHHYFSNGLFVVRRSDRRWGGIPTDQIIEQCLMRNLKTSGGLTHGSGMNEQQRNVWSLSLPMSAAIHQALQDLTGISPVSGEQHKEMSSARITRDWKDTRLVSEFLSERNPFSYGDTFCNIVNGVHAHPSVNAENAKAIGESIIEKMVKVKLSDFSFKRKNQAVTMATKSAVKVDGESVQVDTQLLFQRLVIAAQTDLEQALSFELCTIPKSLFETPELLHEAQKSSLADTLWTKAKPDQVSLPRQAKYILDGGALLHRVPWMRGTSFASIVKSYLDYVMKHYGKAIIVFDGYEQFTTKGMTHLRRSKGKKGTSVSFTLDMNLTMTKDAFLQSTSNKQQFIKLLSDELSNHGCQVFHDKADADLQIVQKTIDSANSAETILVGDDTDLLVLLLYHAPLDKHDVYFAPEPKRNTRNRIWNIKKVKKTLGSFLCKHILFLHSLLGCDTTSRLYGIGKGSILKKFTESTPLQQAAVVFDSPHSTRTQIDTAGEHALVAIYNGKVGDSLNVLRHKKYCDKVATSLASVDPKGLPPTSAAAKFHSRRVFLQINQWKDSNCDMLPETWGWTRGETSLLPTTMDIAPAPAELLKMIRCNCSTDCTSAKCSCKKHGMKCSIACGQCRGSSCFNASDYLEQDNESDDE